MMDSGIVVAVPRPWLRLDVHQGGPIPMISLLSRWRQPRFKADVAHLRIKVYTRGQCGCCHKALDLLKGYQRRLRFAVEEIDIDGDPVLRERYNTTVPVVEVNGKVRFKGAINRVLFERLLLAESREGSRNP
jgi:glutaredoxin